MKRNIVNYVTIFTVLLFSFEAPIIYAQTTDNNILKLDIKQTIDMALKTSEDYEIKGNETQIMKSKQKEAKASLFPNINAAATWTNNFKFPDIPQNQYTKEYDINSGITFTQALFTFGRISSSVRAAKEAMEASIFNHETTKQEIIYDAKLAYFNAFLAKRVLNIARESLARAQKNKEILEERSVSGRVSKQDNIKISADVASRTPVVNNASADYASAMETLRVIIGQKQSDTIELTEELSDSYTAIDRKVLAEGLYNNQPAIKALAKNISYKEKIVKAKRAEYFPEISAFANWNHNGEGDDYYVGDKNLHDSGVAGLKVNLPIWNGGITKEQLAQAKLEKKNAELEYKKGEENYLLELDKAVNEYREYVKTLEANKEGVNLAQESFNLSQDLFKSGQISVADLNDSELLLTNQKMNKEITLFNLNMTLAKIERLTLKVEAKNE